MSEVGDSLLPGYHPAQEHPQGHPKEIKGLPGPSSTISLDQEPSDPGELQVVLHSMEILASLHFQVSQPSRNDLQHLALVPVCWCRLPRMCSLRLGSLSSLLPAPESMGERRTLHLVLSNPAKTNWLLSTTRVQGQGRRELCELYRRGKASPMA